MEDGTIFQGWGFGADDTVIGELVFTTNMVGYVETLTDPSYYGQIILQTFPLIGNYGIMEEDFEGTPRLFGYVVKEWCPTPSNFRCGCTVDEFLKKHHIPASGRGYPGDHHSHPGVWRGQCHDLRHHP